MTSDGRDSSVDSIGTDPTKASESSDSSGPHGTDETGYGDSGDADSSGDGGSDSGSAPEQVVFVYSAPGWDGVSGGGGGMGVLDAAFELCGTNALPECSGDAVPIPLLRADEATIPDLIAELDGMLLNEPVYGPAEFIADSIPEMFTSPLDTSLAVAGVDTHSEDLFWTGGVDKTPNNCANWGASKMSVGAVGSFFETNATWFDQSFLPCGDELPILCACLSVPDPFK